MILTSLVSGEKYFWIKVPRTATIAYNELFLRYYKDDVLRCQTHDPAKGTLHMHYSYVSLCELYNQKLSGVTVVRHPFTRFVSGLHQLKLLSLEHNFKVPFLESTSSCIEFLQKHFGKNCNTSADIRDLILEADPTMSIAFFHLQIYFMYNPKVTWFKYESIHDFNDWITEKLGYDVNLLTRTNESNKELLSHLEFTNREFVEVVENMFYDDYKFLNYPFEYTK
jgi:hypothetical protein